jgi:hypothetical protein
MGDAAIRTEGLRKRYGGTAALDGLDLTVPPGTVRGLLGPNGTGKTTAIRILATLLRHDGGTAQVAGIDAARHPAVVRRRIGLLGQHAALDEADQLADTVSSSSTSPATRQGQEHRTAAPPPRLAAVTDGWILTRRTLMHWAHQPAQVILGLLFPVMTVLMFGFLSDTFVAPATMPGWLGAIAGWNPLSATVSAARELFGNPGWAEGTWPARHALTLALAWPVLITAVFLPLPVRRYRRLGR